MTIALIDIYRKKDYDMTLWWVCLLTISFGGKERSLFAIFSTYEDHYTIELLFIKFKITKPIGR